MTPPLAQIVLHICRLRLNTHPPYCKSQVKKLWNESANGACVSQSWLLRSARQCLAATVNRREKMPDILHRAFTQRLHRCRHRTRKCTQSHYYQTVTVLYMFMIVILHMSQTFISVEWEDAGADTENRCGCNVWRGWWGTPWCINMKRNLKNNLDIIL